MKNRLRVLISLFLLLFTMIVSADLQHARELEEAGKTTEAFKHYKAWLAENIGRPDFMQTLNRALDLADGVESEIELLSDHLYSVGNPADRHTLLKRLALLEEYSGALSEAQMHYELASFVDPKGRDYQAFLSSALILFELGDVDRAEAQAKTLIRLSPDPEVSFKGKLLLARTYTFQERLEEADILINDLAGTVDVCCPHPLSYFTLYELAHRVGNTEVKQRAQDVLNDQFPDSIETALLSGMEGVELYPSPGRFLTLEDIQFLDSKTGMEPEGSQEVPEIGIQTGSFTVKENAEYMVQDLENAGFSPLIEEKDMNGRTYYKVIIPNVPFEDSQSLMILLKENGFEGFMVFP